MSNKRLYSHLCPLLPLGLSPNQNNSVLPVTPLVPVLIVVNGLGRYFYSCDFQIFFNKTSLKRFFFHLNIILTLKYTILLIRDFKARKNNLKTGLFITESVL